VCLYLSLCLYVCVCVCLLFVCVCIWCVSFCCIGGFGCSSVQVYSWQTRITHSLTIFFLSCVLVCSCAQVIFTQYQFAEGTLIPPTALRKALHTIYEERARFQINDIDDAAEALEAVLTCLDNELSGRASTVCVPN
jgi:hypothetical protein